MGGIFLSKDINRWNLTFILFSSMTYLITKALGYVPFYRHSSSFSWFITHTLICLVLHFPLNYKIVEINEDHPNENKHKLFIQCLLKQGSQPTSLAFGRDSKAGWDSKAGRGTKNL